MDSELTLTNKSKIKNIIAGTLISISITLVLILAFAFIIKFTNLNDKFIFPINQLIKIISLFVGVIVSLKKSNEKGFFKGILVGLFYFTTSFIIFSILQSDWNFQLSNIYDLLLTTLMSGLIGIIIVNIRK